MEFTYKEVSNPWVPYNKDFTEYTCPHALTLFHREFGTEKWLVIKYKKDFTFYVDSTHRLTKLGDRWELEYKRGKD